MSGRVIASSAGSDFHLWSDLLQVVLWGAGAGIGLAVIYGLAMRGLIIGSVARREGRSVAGAAHTAMGLFFSVLCVVAVVAALATMLHR